MVRKSVQQTNRHDFNTCNSEVIGKLSSMASQVGKSSVWQQWLSEWLLAQRCDSYQKWAGKWLVKPVSVCPRNAQQTCHSSRGHWQHQQQKNTPDPSVKQQQQQQLSGFSIPTVISGCRRDAAARRSRKTEYLTGPFASLLVQRLRSGQNGLVNWLIGRH